MYPMAIGADDDDDEEDEDEEFESIPQPVYVPHTRAANDAHVEVAPPRKEAAPPIIPAAPVRRSEIPRPPRAPDTLIDELIPRADEEAAAALAGALEEFAGARARLLAEAEGDLFALAKAIAERVVARELRSDPRVITQLVREGLSALSAGDACTVRLGRFFSGVVDDVRRAVGDIAMDVTVVVEPTLPTYGCVVESQWGRVDESVEARLRTLLDQLDAMRVRSGGG
jgi:vacuolar-type H+-ATPase subunit E/Vma4